MKNILLTVLALLTAMTAYGQQESPKTQSLDTLSYCTPNAYCYNTVGGNNGTTWGVCFPASELSGRRYLHGVRLYVSRPGTYSLMLYQGGTDAPQQRLDSLSYRFTANGAWVDCTLDGMLPLDTASSLWVVFSNTDVSAPAAYCVFTGDSNSSLVCTEGRWSYIQRVMPGMDPYPTWMIAAVTGNELTVDIEGPSAMLTALPATFTAHGPTNADYQWTLEGGNPATGTDRSITAVWDQPGLYNISVTAIAEGDTVSAQTTLEVFDCSTPKELPFACGFEPTQHLGCWTFLDADGDGNGWDFQRWTGDHAHTGEGVAASASRSNNIFNPALHPDNWMITPEIRIPASGATLSWWAGNASNRAYAERYSVLASTSGTDSNQFTVTLFSDTLHSSEYQHMEVSLASLAGQTVYLAFRHHDCSNVYWLLIDDIEVTETVAIDECTAAKFHLYPNPTTGLLHIDGPHIKEVSVTDACGRQLLRTHTAHALDLRPYGNGVYFVRITSDEGTIVKKVVKN